MIYICPRGDCYGIAIFFIDKVSHLKHPNVYLSRGSTARRLTCKDFYASNQKLKTYERKYPLSISYMMFDAKFCMIDY